jgi:hypothetical protein
MTDFRVGCNSIKKSIHGIRSGIEKGNFKGVRASFVDSILFIPNFANSESKKGHVVAWIQ